tara:strand:+ start:243 stop:686 length:444 start_codon:yes stop_codon:yes gene_type:complete
MSEDAGELVADAIVDYVNDFQRSYSFEFTATNPTDPTTALQLDSDGNESDSLQVFAVPTTELRERIDGTALNIRPTVNLFVSNYLDAGVTRRQMNKLTREIFESLEHVEMAGFSWESTELVAKYDPEKLSTQNRFISVTGLTYFDVG